MNALRKISVPLMGIIILLLSGYILYNKFRPRKKYTKEEAYFQAQAVIKERLKSPGTANFSDPYIAQMNDTAFMCSGDVDAQNGFGGYKRGYWSVVITFMPDGLINRHHAIMESRDE